MTATTPAPPEGWVPADSRWLGFDRSTLGYAAAVLALFTLMHIVFPLADHLVRSHDVVKRGDVLALKGGVTFEPAVGWNIQSGLREGGSVASGELTKSAEVVNGDVSFEVTTDPFTGDDDALLAQIKKTTDVLNSDTGLHVVGPASGFTTSTGLAGTLSRYESSATNGVIAAIVHDGVGIEVVATSGSEMDQATVEQVAAMLDSLSQTSEATP